MSVSLTRYGMAAGLAAGAVLLAGCGGSGSKAGASTAPTSSESAAPTDSGSAAPSGGTDPSGAPSGGATGAGYTGPTVGPGHKCGTVTVVTGSIQCSHAEKIFELYAQNKKADGKATFNGWTCTKEPVGVICSRTGIRLHSTA